MARPRQAALTVSILVASLLLNVTLVSCGAEPTAPQGPTADVLEKLTEISERLAAIEAKMDAHETDLADRIDSLETRVTSVASGASPLEPQDAARVDSILALASYLALDASTASWEGCGKLSFEMQAKVGIQAEGKGEGKASVGAWAGTGAFAGALVAIKNNVEGEVALGMPFEFGVCLPLFDAAPDKIRPAAGPGGARLASASISSSLNSTISQLGLTPQKLETALGGVSGVFSSGSFPSTQALAATLPLPTALSSKFSDPLGSLQSETSARVNEAITALCSGSWGPILATPISTACGRIDSGATDISGLFAMMESFPAVQTTLTTVSGITGAICTRMNTMGNRSLTIPNPFDFGPENLYGPSRIFPSYTNVSC